MLDVLFELETWHALVKLQIHTKMMIDLLAAATETLTSAMRRFCSETCKDFDTRELEKKVAVCVAKGDSRAGKGKVTTGSKPKKLNLATYKYHALADYAETI